jgi:hypothetical protein
MDPRLFTNNASSTLQAGISDSDTLVTIDVTDAAQFPSPVAGQYFLVTLEDRLLGRIEIVKCTDRNVADLTVVRGQEGTTPVAFNSGVLVSVRLTAGATQALVDEVRLQRATWLRPGTSLPLVDDNGDPLAAGSIFFKTDDDSLWRYLGGMWNQIPFAAGSILEVLNEGAPEFSDVRSWNYVGALVRAVQNGGDPQQADILIGPAADGTVGQVLTTDGAGVFSFQSIPPAQLTLNDILDTDVPAPIGGDALVFNGISGKWATGVPIPPERAAQFMAVDAFVLREKSIGITSVVRTGVGRWTIVVDNSYIPDVRLAYFTSFAGESADAGSYISPRNYGSWTANTMFIEHRRSSGAVTDAAFWTMVIWPDGVAISG